jgi:NADP-dependent 3-hydroxy acid dehydrogenase YdfG
MVVERMAEMREKIGKVLESEGIARAIVYATTQPAHVNVHEMLIMPTGQSN